MAEGVAHRISGRRAAGRNDMAQAAESEAHGNFASKGPDSACGNRIHAALLYMTGVVKAVLFFREILTAASGADQHANLAKLFARHPAILDAGVLKRLRDSRCRQWHGARNVRPIFDLDVLLVVEIVRNLTRDLNCIPAGIETRDPADATLSTLCGLPETLAPDSIW